MVLYECECCNFSSKLKNNYFRHLKTKKHLKRSEESLPQPLSQESCKKNIPNIPLNIPISPPNIPVFLHENSDFSCIFCKSSFSSFSNKRRHELHRCRKNPNYVNKILETKNKKIKKLEMEKKKMKREIEKLLTTVSTTTTNNNTTNNNNNITYGDVNNNVIIVNNYGKENTNYLTEDYLKKLLDKPYGGIQNLIKNIHFHPNHPENHNVKITNKKLPYALVWNDKIWETRNKKEVIEDLVDKGYMIMDTTNEIIDETNKKYDSFADKYESGENKDDIAKEAEMLLINETKKLE